MGHDGFWKERVPLVIHNNTDLELAGVPLVIEVGRGSDRIPLKGALAEAIRVTNQQGKQLLYRLNGPDGNLIEEGPVPIGATLTVPVECPARDEVTCFIYSDNTSAWRVGEYFYTHREVSNGGFELNGVYGPLGWELEWPEDNRKVEWSDSESHSGQHSLKISASQAGVEGLYGAIQENIHLIAGVSYTVEAWIKAENLQGEAGLMLLPKNLERTKRDLELESFRITSDEGSFDWKKETIEFIAPEESNVLTLNTFIEGTGTLWMDDIQVTCDYEYDIQAEVLPKETAPVIESGRMDRWYGGETGDTDWPLRASIVVPNFTDKTLEGHPVYVDIQQLLNRLYSEVDNNTRLLVTKGTNPIPHMRMGNALLFKQDIEASTVQTFYVYFSDKGRSAGLSAPDTFSDLSQITENLVLNPGFADADISGWERFGETGSKVITMDEEEGNPMVQLIYTETEDDATSEVQDIEVSHTDGEAGMGLYQVIDVEPGSSYFFTARVKGSDVLNRTYTLRTRFLDSEGVYTGVEESLRINPDMYQNHQWIQESMILQIPVESVSARIELSNSTEGKVWYDDVFFMKIHDGFTGAMSLERKAAAEMEELVIWQENPIVKIFPDDLPDEGADLLSLSAARNEVEPLQLVFRSPKEYKQLEIRITPPTDSGGNQLNDMEIGVVGYVPINCPSNYYRDFETKFWQTKMPFGTIGSDGWTGWWPDPILPVHTFDLPSNYTKAAWIEIAVPEDAVPGAYKGNVSIIHRGKVVKEIPLEIQVFSFVLPEAFSVSATYDVRFNNEELFGRKTTEQEKIEEIWTFMKRHRMSPETIRPQPEFTVKDGEVSVDFTEFDKAGAYYFDELKIQATYTPWVFYLCGWGHPPEEKFGEKPYPGNPPYSDVDRSKLRPEFVELYQSALGQYWEHMKEMGWADKVVMYISDEPHADHEIVLQMKALCDMIHEVDPEIPIYVSTWWYRPEFEGYIDIWGVSHRGGGWGHPVPAEHLELIRKNGGEIFFTTDGQNCTDTPYLGFERLITYFCYKYGAREYEFWATSWHTLDPYKYGWHRYHRQYASEEVKYWMRYPDGDGTFIYPGPPIGVDQVVASIRVKQIREGVEDYEYMKLLDQLIQECSSKGIETMNAREALGRALDLVNIPTGEGRYTTQWISDPDEILEIRDEIALAIEELSAKTK